MTQTRLYENPKMVMVLEFWNKYFLEVETHICKITKDPIFQTFFWHTSFLATINIIENETYMDKISPFRFYLSHTMALQLFSKLKCIAMKCKLRNRMAFLGIWQLNWVGCYWSWINLGKMHDFFGRSESIITDLSWGL